MTSPAASKMNRGWRAVALRLALACFSVVFTFIVLEIGLRLFADDSRLFAGLRQIDDELGWRTTPNLDVTYPTVDGAGTPYVVHQTYDADGFRNCRPAERGDGRPVLLCVGDSFTAAGEVSDGETWHCRTGELLGADSWGFGTGGYGTLQELIVLRRHIDRVDPDVVVLQFCTNDFINNSFDLELASYGNNNSMPRPYLVDGGIVKKVPQKLGMLRFHLRKNLRLAEAVFGALDRNMASRPGIEQEIVREGLAHPGLQRSMRTTAELLREVRKACGDRPLFAFIVNKDDPFQAAFEQVCSEAGVERIPEVADEVDSLGPKGKAHDGGHWSPLGHEIAAQRIAAHLREREAEMFATETE